MDQASRAVPTMYVLKTALCLALLLQICDGNIDAKCSEQQDVCSLDCFLRQQCWTPRLPDGDSQILRSYVFGPSGF